jgi:predicted SAM-dependent methyltransferase
VRTTKHVLFRRLRHPRSLLRALWAKRAVSATREALAARYLRGTGIEIGALHNPLRTPPGALVRYIDRLHVTQLREHYPELNALPLVEVDIIDDGERLEAIPDGSLDFVIANHFLEHCQDPLRALVHFCRVLRVGGIVYLAVPDKRRTFDVDRPVTSLEHLLEDHAKGPARSRRAHFEEWARLVDRVDDSELDRRVEELMAKDYSIHYHVWTQAELLELLAALRNRLQLPFEVEVLARNQHEHIVILERCAQ